MIPRARRQAWLVMSFLLGAVAITIALDGFISNAIGLHVKAQYDELFDPSVLAKVMILGSSRATYGINPKEFPNEGRHTFNFALNAAGPRFYLDWYAYAATPYYPTPRVVVYNVDWFMFDSQHLHRQFHQDSEWFPIPLLVKMLHKEGKRESYAGGGEIGSGEFIRSSFNVISQRHMLMYILFAYDRVGDLVIKDSIYHGFIATGNPNFPLERTMDDGLGGVDEVSVMALDTLVGTLRDKGVQVIFISSPEYWQPHNTNLRLYLEHLNALEAIRVKHDIPYLDYRTDPRFDMNTNLAYFSDWVHLNEVGASVFSRRLGRDLVKLGVEF